MSLSARRAWIEIDGVVSGSGDYVVALRKESVDRNSDNRRSRLALDRSLSARRAWIEMDVKAATGLFTSSRSPQGERG